MSNSTRSARELLQSIDGRWPAGGEEPKEVAVEARLGELLGAQPESVRKRLEGLLEDPASEALSRTLIYALQVGELVGVKAAGWLGDDRLHMVDGQGRSLAIGLLGVDVPRLASGDVDAGKQLEGALSEAFGDRRYVLWMRKPLPKVIDAPAIGRAVTLWLSAIERGEWHGNHAIYEDDTVELELVLTDERREQGSKAELLRLQPVTALERLSDVDRALVDRAAAHDEEHPDVPLVFAVGATARWRLPRGFPEQLFYGTADWIRTSTDPVSYEAAFHASGRALFCDPLAANIASVWWLEPSADAPLGFNAWSHDNPWARCSWTPQPPPGPRFVRTGSDTGASGRQVELMHWTAPWAYR